VRRPPVAADLVNPQVWTLLGAIETQMAGSWVLVGGQMVLLHGLEAGQLPVRETTDADALVNVRLVPRGTSALAQTLVDLDLTLDGYGPDGIGHRFVGRGVSIDILAPDNLGKRADLTTVPPARTIEIPAGTRLLREPQRCPVAVAGRVHHIPRPSLDSAIVGKAAAFRQLADSARHGEDLVFLLGIVSDVTDLDGRLDARDRKVLRAADDKLAGDQRMWRYASDPDAARAVLRFVLRDA